MHILDKIVAHKIKEVAHQKTQVTVQQLEQSPYFQKGNIDIKEHFQNSTGIIAEFKRRSPSKPSINLDARSTDIVRGYEQAGATASSVLTDSHFFGGAIADLLTAREVVNMPLLRKDFIIDEYQIIEAKSIGANIILLIAEVLTQEQIKGFCQIARDLDLSILFEIYQEDHLDKYDDKIDMVGINNRDLTQFTVDYKHSITLYEALPKDVVKISESGISNVDIIQELSEVGFDGFLIGEAFMKTDNPAQACQEFISALH